MGIAEGYSEAPAEVTLDYLASKIEELQQALALTNERLEMVIKASSKVDVLPDEYDKTKIWMKLGIKKIADMTKEELKAMNEMVTARLSGTKATTTEAAPQETYEQIAKKYEGKEEKTAQDAVLMLAKLVVQGEIDRLQREIAEEAARPKIEEVTQ